MPDPSPPGDPAEAATPDDPANASTPDGAPTPRRYRTPDLDAPQYAVPAYAAPEPGDASPTAPSIPGPYAAPHGYGLAGTDPRGADHLLPPYARDGAAQASGYPVAPGYPTTSAYPAAPGSPTAPAYPVPGGRDSRPKALAIVALVLAGAGVLLLFVGVGLGSGAGLLAPLLLLAAFVLSLVALLSRNQGGKGFGAGALAASVLGGLVSVVVVVSVLGPFSTSSRDDVVPNTGDGYDDYAIPGVAAPGTDGQPDPGAQFPTPQRPTVTETAFGHDFGDIWWYVVVVDNPNADYVFDAFLDAQAYAEDGTVIGSSTAIATLLSGQTAVVGYFTIEGEELIDTLEVTVPEASHATLSPADETGSFRVDGLAGTPDPGGTSTRTPPGTATGTVSGRFADDQRYVAVTVVARAIDGRIVRAATAYVDEVPGDGTPVPFEAWFAEFPPDVTLQASAHR
ncbi:hypothetical protein ACFVSU_04960 [Microbacterium sp. NPDC058062]|uniref:hypothetical protein n=1 Tax=Microbacterium sp. NPDC058062 TaxID=3346320 RepID=UPI0036D7D984